MFCVPILGFIVSAFYLFRSKKIHPLIALSWSIGTITSIIGLYLILHWNDSNHRIDFGHNFAIYLFECGQGILYWLLAFEFYTSAQTMEEILFYKPQSLIMKKKFTIFGVVSGTYMLLQIGLVYLQFKID